MEIQFDDNIKRARFPLLVWMTSRQAFWVSVAVILACIFLSFATNSFATSNNIFNVARNFTFVAIVALGMTIVIITGGIDLSVGSVLCLCSMILAVVMHAGYSIEVGIAASLGTALLIGAINGVLIAYLGIPPFVVTLGMLSIARSLAMVASNNTVVYQFGPDHDKLLFLAGGIGTAFGALIGSALIEVIRNSLGLLGISAFWQGTFIGTFIIIAVAFDRIRNFRSPA